MAKKIFEIYDGRKSFWQWDTYQKIIINDESIVEVRFGSSNEKISKRRIVYRDTNGRLACDVPNSLLEKSKNLIVYGCVVNEHKCPDDEHKSKISSSTVCMMKFAVAKQEKPEGYISSDESALDAIYSQLAELAKQIKDVDKKTEMQKFSSVEDAKLWAEEKKTNGIIVLVNISDKWVAHIINNDYTVTPICNSDNEMITMDIDGGSSFGVMPLP